MRDDRTAHLGMHVTIFAFVSHWFGLLRGSITGRGRTRECRRPSHRWPSSRSPGPNRFGSTLSRLAVLGTLSIASLLLCAHAALAATLELDRTIQTTPFTGTSVSMGDNEGSSFVPSDHSLWLADDIEKRVYEVNSTTGALKRTIARKAFIRAPRLGGGPQAGKERSNDFEAVAYSRRKDVLYVFSGPCCSPSMKATAFRLTRRSGRFRVESYQTLPTGADYTAAAWSRSDRKIYVGKGSQMRSFRYASGTAGPSFSIAGVGGITGMDFSPNGADLYVTVNSERLIRIDWSTKTVVSGWSFDLAPFGILDCRAVAKIHGRFFVSDGSESRPSGDPLRHAVFAFGVTG